MPTLEPQTNAPRQIFHIDACSLYHIRGGYYLTWTYCEGWFLYFFEKTMVCPRWLY